MPTARVRGINVRFEDVGTGPAILFIHGHPFDRRIWRPQLKAFATEARCIAPDLCGYGGSGGRPYRVLLDEIALDLLHLLDELGVENPVVCGVAMGVQVALDLVRIAPKRVAGMLLASGSARADTEEEGAARGELADLLERDGSMDRYVHRNLSRFFSGVSSRGRMREATEVAAIIRACSAYGAAAGLRGRAVRRDLNRVGVRTLTWTLGCDTLKYHYDNYGCHDDPLGCHMETKGYHVGT